MKTKITFGISLVAVLVGVLYVMSPKGTFNPVQKEVVRTYGPFSCGAGELLVKEIVHENRIEGAIVPQDVEFALSGKIWRVLKYPVHNPQEDRGLITEASYTEAEKEAYVNSITSTLVRLSSTPLVYEDQHQLISDTYVTNEELEQFKKCYNQYQIDFPYLQFDSAHSRPMQ
jgi:hypothetical protein